MELTPRQQSLYNRVLAFYREAGIQVPSVRFASRFIGAPPDAIKAMLELGIQRGEVVYLGEGLYYPLETLQQVAEQLRQLPEPIRVADVRNLTQSSRRYAHAILQWYRSQS
ncbi:MAG: hypothetical protein SNJ72_07895 [Fimbriimonadales bacterium]